MGIHDTVPKTGTLRIPRGAALPPFTHVLGLRRRVQFKWFPLAVRFVLFAAATGIFNLCHACRRDGFALARSGNHVTRSHRKQSCRSELIQITSLLLDILGILGIVGILDILGLAGREIGHDFIVHRDTRFDEQGRYRSCTRVDARQVMERSCPFTGAVNRWPRDPQRGLFGSSTFSGRFIQWSSIFVCCGRAFLY